MLHEALSNDDYKFQFHLFDWFMEGRMFNQLLQLETPALEIYLSSDESSIDKLDLLWQHHELKEQFHKASEVLQQIAETRKYLKCKFNAFRINLTLEGRIERLSRAVHNARSTSSQSNLYSDTLQTLEEKMEVIYLLLIIRCRKSNLWLEKSFYNLLIPIHKN